MDGDLLSPRNIKVLQDEGILNIRHTHDLATLRGEYNLAISNSLKAQGDSIKRLGGYFAGHLNFNEVHIAKSIFEVLVSPETLEGVREYLECNHISIRTNANLNFPGSKFQHWHFDGDYGRNFLILNVPLTEITTVNGPTEVLKGSHLHTSTFRRFVHSRDTRQLLKMPLQVDEVVFRDSRLWHRGTPNASADMRPMLAFIFERSMPDREGFLNADPRPHVYNNMYGSSLKGRAREILLVQSRRVGYLKRYIFNDC